MSLSNVGKFPQTVPAKAQIRAGRDLVLILVVLLAVVVNGQPARAADGDLDPTFGAGGKVVTDFNNSTDWLSRVAVQPDGKIVAIGDTHPSHKGALARYNPDGTLDATFGNGGKVITVATVRESAAGLLILPDGKIMVSGSISLPSSFDTSFVLLRFNSDGSVDTTFGNGGMVTTNIAPVDDQANAIALQSDGKIVAAGRRGIQIEPAQQRKGHVALARYNSDGSLDATFGNGGTVENDFGQGLESYAIALMIQPDGKLVIAGGSSYEFLVARYNSNGTLDTTFGGSGFRLANFSSNWDAATDAALQPDGKIVLVGWSELNSPYDSFAVARFNSDGSFDQSFGNSGKVLLTDQGALHAVALQSDGKLLALGSSNSFSDSRFLLLRFNVNGALDSTFGSGGTVATDFGRPTEGAALVFQADGKLLAGGLTSSDPYFTNSDFALARYQFGSFQLPGAVSRKTHGASVYDLALPLTGTAAIEPRSGGSASEHQIVFTFPGSVTLTGATVTAAPGRTAEIKGAITRSADGRTVTVGLINVSDAQTITVTLRNVNDGNSTRDVAMPMSLLRGDTNGDGVVNAADATQTRSRAGAPADANN
ncbi:MAG: delta-60 repeat domain-containing protein, partial [Chthoniobacterales bacterium]